MHSRTETSSELLHTLHQGAETATFEMDPRVVDYLDHVFAPLVGKVPVARRLELRAELTEHLEAMIEARQELGETYEEALCGGLRQFGEPGQLARLWLVEWNRILPAPESMWQAARRGIRCFVPAALISLPIVVFTSSHGVGPSDVLLVAFTLPAVAGVATGMRTRRWRLLAGCAGAAAVSLTAALIALLTRSDSHSLGTMAMISAVCWVPVGGLTSEITGWLRDRVARVRRPRRFQQV